eukprot:318946_1
MSYVKRVISCMAIGMGIGYGYYRLNAPKPILQLRGKNDKRKFTVLSTICPHEWCGQKLHQTTNGFWCETCNSRWNTYGYQIQRNRHSWPNRSMKIPLHSENENEIWLRFKNGQSPYKGSTTDEAIRAEKKRLNVPDIGPPTFRSVNDFPPTFGRKRAKMST